MSQKRRTAFISGSGRNIGRAIALALAAEGVNVIVNGSARRELCEPVAEEARALGVESVVLMGDVGNREDVARMTASALEQFGTVDILVSNAAIRPRKPFLDVTETEWDQVFDTNLKSLFRLSQGFLPSMIDQGWGRIIGLAGMNAIKGQANRTHGSAVKHAVWGLIKALAVEFADKGITANAISPGVIQGDRDTREKADQIAGDVQFVPIGRHGRPDEVAVVAAMLVSDRGAFVNGQMIQVNGGAVT